MFFELLHVRQFMPDPFAVIDEFLRGGIVQQNGFTQYHGHFILLQLPGCHTGQKRIFFDIILHMYKINCRANAKRGTYKNTALRANF